MSDTKNEFRNVFGEEPDASANEAGKSNENYADYPDEIHEEKPAIIAEDDIPSEEKADDAVTDQKDTVSEDANENAQDDIKHDAKTYFNSTYQSSLEDRIMSIRENALNTYAKESDEEAVKENTQDSELNEDDDMKIMTFGDKDDAEDASVNTEECASDNSGTRSYDMTQLIKILKNSEEDSDDENDGSVRKKKGKADKNVGFTEETDAVKDESDEDCDCVAGTNEYPCGFEFTEKCQGNDLFKSFRKSAVIATLSLILTFFFTVLCLWIECGHGAGLPFAKLMHPGYYGRVYAMLSLQMLAFCVLFNLDGLFAGVRKLSVKRAAPEAVAFISVCVCALHTLYTAISAYNSVNYATYCFAGCITLLFLSFNTFVKAYTRFKSFSMVLSKSPKLTNVKLDTLSEENGVFSKYFIENSEAFTVSKTDFVSDFAKNTYKVPAAVGSCNIFLYLSLILGVITAILKVAFFEASAYDGITGGVAVVMFSIPAGFLLVSALPYFVTSSRTFALRNAIIGEAACDSLENVAVLSFDDTEVFPPKTVKVTNINTYNDSRIDKAIVCMAKIFSKLGGPLSHVFASSLQDSFGDGSDVMVIESSRDGIHLTVDGEDVLVGTSNYLRMFDIEVPIDSKDESELRSLTSILYLVNAGQLSAKFYIKYSMNRRFERILEKFYDAGVCCGVKTSDPGIDNRLIEANLSSGKYPISVIQKNAKDIGKTEEKSDGVLIGLSGIHNFLVSFIMLDRLRDTCKTNSVLAAIFTFIGLAASMILVFMGTKISALVLVLFYLFWALVITLVSIFRK